MILPYQELLERGHAGTLLSPFDPSLVNPASIDIRVGTSCIKDDTAVDLSYYTETTPYWLHPGGFLLVATLEVIKVPVDCAMDLRLKSSCARAGYDHALAFWFDPGWEGIGTMELTNNAPRALPLYPGMRIAQVIYHRLTAPCAKPYTGRYNQATTVELPKWG